MISKVFTLGLILLANGNVYADTLFWAIPLNQNAAKPKSLSSKFTDGLAARRAKTELPGEKSIVPSRLQPLVMDFAIMFDDLSQPNSPTRCNDYQLKEMRRKVPDTISPPDNSEIWSIDACGTRLAFSVGLAPCNNSLNSPLVRVKTAYTPSGTLLGANPFDATFVLSCPDVQLTP